MRLLTIIIFLALISQASFCQVNPSLKYWNRDTHLIPWRLPLPEDLSKINQIDLDNDGDPDIIEMIMHDSIPLLWIDDDDDMRSGDIEGDIDNDCLLIDRNHDGIFAGPNDLSIDWGDEDNDGIADIQLVVQNGDSAKRYYFDWDSDFMYFIDLEKDNRKHFINWNAIRMQAWEHSGHSNFFEDYQGNTLFLKMHASSFRIQDTRYSWENPFIFFDTDDDNLSEWTIRLVDTPHFRQKDRSDEKFNAIHKEIDVIYSKKINDVRISWDLDNDNGQGNEFDFDMSLRLNGPGFDYSDQVHKYKSLRGLPDADKFFYNAQWRQTEELIYPDHKTAWDLIFKKGQWNECRMVFDEDDDCNRWERVEFYDPRDLYLIGRNKGGLDHNAQADAMGDRCEWDMDFSGKAQLYVGPFDGRIHLYGAEWGAWRIDQTAYSFQGFGGIYDRWKGSRLQREPSGFATVKYSDSDENGFIDLIEYDLDGDRVIEDRISLKELNIDDRCELIQTAEMQYVDFQKLFEDITDKLWQRAQDAMTIATKHKINPGWYSFFMNPRTLNEKYDYGYWLNFYLYQDLRHMAYSRNDKALTQMIDKAYYSGNWGILMK